MLRFWVSARLVLRNASLSEDQRETLRLHFFDGYSLAEISAKLAQPLGNVRHHYYRGLDKLREQMFGRKVRES
jgi:RNA polymerase sigma-70 factor (ECF subfamily)